MTEPSRWIKRVFIALVTLFILMNIVAALHAYRFTHFSLTATEPSPRPEELSLKQKLSALTMGVKTPKPQSTARPSLPYSTVTLSTNPHIAAWHIGKDHSPGTVVLFHGYIADKGKMLDKAEVLHAMGYSTLLVDFMGSGESEGTQTTIGYYEAQQVRDAFRYLQEQGETNIYLFGTSMGAVAIMKALDDYQIQPRGVILECPFGTLYETVCARFDAMGVPTFPMASLLVFWGGIENGYWGFSHNPEEYAFSVDAPVLLMYGAKDARVSRKEIDRIYTNLPEEKELIVFPEAGHENYLIRYSAEWQTAMGNFLVR